MISIIILAAFMLELPEADAYEGFPMLENGVGMVRLLLDRFREAAPDPRQLRERGPRR